MQLWQPATGVGGSILHLGAVFVRPSVTVVARKATLLVRVETLNSQIHQHQVRGLLVDKVDISEPICSPRKAKSERSPPHLSHNNSQ